MKKRFLSILTALSLALSLLPTAAFAEEGDVINVDGETYTAETLMSSVVQSGNDISVTPFKTGSTVTLLDDYTMELGSGRLILPEGNFTIDLNGHKLELNSSYQMAIYAADTDLTIQGGELSGSAVSFLVYSTNRTTTGSLTMESVKVNFTATGSEPMAIFAHGQTTSFENVDITANAGCVDVSGTAEFTGCTFTTTGDGVGTGHPFTAVAVCRGGTATIYSGTYSAPYALYVYNTGGTIDVRSGIFTGTEAVLRADTRGKISVSDGEFVGSITENDTGEIEISGGSFTADPTAYLASGLYAPDDTGKFVVQKDPNQLIELRSDSDAIKGTYATFADALSAVDGTYRKMVLLGNVAVESPTTISTACTIDLNGNDLSGAKLTLSVGIYLTIKGDGGVSCDIENLGTQYILKLDGGSYSGTITGEMSANEPNAKFSTTTYTSPENVPLHITGYRLEVDGDWYEFQANTYKVTLNPTSGTLPEGTEESFTFEYSGYEKLAVPKTGEVTRPSYTFGGWYFDEMLSDSAASASRGYVTSDDIAGWADENETTEVTLYAKWTKAKEAAIFDANGDQVGEDYNTLQEAITAATTGQTVRLLTDVLVTSTGGQNSDPGVLIDKAITLDGNGKTIVAESFTAPNSIVSVENVTGQVVIQNLKIKGPGAENDANVKHGLNVYNSDNVTIRDVTASDSNGYGLVANGSQVTVESMDISSCGWGAVNADSNVAGKNTSLTIEDGTFTAPVGKNAVQVDQQNAGQSSAVSITGGTFNSPIQTTASDVSIQVSGGTFAQQIDEAYCAKGYAPVNLGNGQYGVAPGGNELFSSGDGSEDNPYVISNVDQLKNFRDSVNGANGYPATDYDGLYVRLETGTYTLSGEWTPIGISVLDEATGTYAHHPFRGSFDGGNSTITGLTLTGDNTACYKGFNTGYSCFGFFGGVDGGTVKNLTFTDFNVTTPGADENNNTVAVAVGAASNGAVLSKIQVGTAENPGAVTGHSRAAGVVGYVGSDSNDAAIGKIGQLVVEDCTNYAAVTSQNHSATFGTAGGICATVNNYHVDEDGSSVTFQGNRNYGDITGFFASGILASSFTYASTDMFFTGNLNYGNIRVMDNAMVSAGNIPAAAGISMGSVDNAGGCRAVFQGNENHGSVTNGVDGPAAGILTSGYSSTTFAGTNANHGNITGTTHVGGIVGRMEGDSITAGETASLAGLTNTGNVTANAYRSSILDDATTCAGGIVGYLSNERVTLDGSTCENTGTISLDAGVKNPDYAGELVGCLVYGHVKDVAEDDAIGSLRLVGNGAFTVKLENVQLDALRLAASHNAQNTGDPSVPHWWYTLEMTEGSRIGTLELSGQAHTGMNLAVSGGTVDEIVAAGLTENRDSEGKPTDERVTSTMLAVKAENSARVGTVNTEAESNNINVVRVTAADASSSIERVEAGKCAVQAGISAVPNLGTIGTVVTSASYSIETETGSTGGAEEVLLSSAVLTGDAEAILNDTATGNKANFTGVSLTADATITGSFTIADGKTLVVEEGVTLTIEANAELTGGGTIDVQGTLIDNRTPGGDESVEIVTYCTVSFDSAGGYTVASQKVEKDGIAQDPGSPGHSNPHYTFLGWYLNGALYQFNTPVTEDLELVAVWRDDTPEPEPEPEPTPDEPATPSYSGGSDSEPSYSPVQNVSEGGTIRVSPRTAEEGDEVTITPDPDAGYEVADVTVTRNGRAIEVTANRDGTYTFTQPAGRVTIDVTFQRIGADTFFTDVPETFWAYDEIAWAYESGYVNGVTATTFNPNGAISRQQVWMILARLSGYDPADMAAARTWAMENGVSDGTNPGNAVTRQQLVALLFRFAELRNYANDQRADLSTYPDAGTVAEYAVEPMQWSVANDIVGGTTAGTLNPEGTATRAQFAVILYRFWSNVV